MPSNVHWLIDKRVLTSHLSGNVTITELQESLPLALMEQGSPPIHTVIDMQEMTHYNVDLGDFAQLAPQLRHTSLGWMVFIGVENAFTRFMIQTIIQMYQLKAQIVESLDAALEFLLEIDASLTPS